MQVIGAGYGRTATKSLQLALEELGFGRCYHMEALLRAPSGVHHWQNAKNRTEVDWDALFSGFESIVDFPGSIYYKELAAFYPNAKVILSVRDAESWYKSVRATIYEYDPGLAIKLKMLAKLPFSQTAQDLFQVIRLVNNVIWKQLFEDQFEDKVYVIRNYETHIQEVKKNFPEDRLLVFDAKDGWEPLCNFLSKDVPSKPYPHANNKEDFEAWSKSILHDVLS